MDPEVHSACDVCGAQQWGRDRGLRALHTGRCASWHREWTFHILPDIGPPESAGGAVTQEIEMPCPQCGHDGAARVGQTIITWSHALRWYRSVDCPNCGRIE